MLKIPSGNVKPQFVKLTVAACCPTSTLLAARVEHIGLIVPSEQTLNCQSKHISFVLLLPDWNWIRFNIQRFVFGHQISCLLVFFEVFCDSVSSTSLASARQNVHVETGTRHKSFSYRYLQLVSAVITTKKWQIWQPWSWRTGRRSKAANLVQACRYPEKLVRVLYCFNLPQTLSLLLCIIHLCII